MVMAHELKAPLALIRQIALIYEHYSEAEKETAFRRIECLSDRSLRLVSLLTKSYSQQEFDREVVNVNRVVEEVAHEFLPMFKELDQSFDLQLKKKPLLVRANKEILYSIISGLCDNALYYGSKSQPIIFSTGEKHGFARIKVEDSGPHIENANLRSKKTSPKRPNSSGLGLYIAEQFALKMDSAIGTVRRRNSGMTFYLDVPVSKQLELFL
jgi:two-component system sensor histidine kinase TctE